MREFAGQNCGGRFSWKAETRRQTCLSIKIIGQNSKLTEQVNGLMEQNVALTRTVHDLTERIETLTVDLRDRRAAPHA